MLTGPASAAWVAAQGAKRGAVRGVKAGKLGYVLTVAAARLAAEPLDLRLQPLLLRRGGAGMRIRGRSLGLSCGDAMLCGFEFLLELLSCRRRVFARPLRHGALALGVGPGSGGLPSGLGG